MTLPGLAAQELYARLAWGVIVAAIAVRALDALPARLDRASRALVRRSVAVFLFAAMWLPGAYSPVFWLGIALQAPSVTLAVLGAAWIIRRERSGRDARAPALWPVAPAATIAVAGLLLYAGTFAWLPLDLYGAGFVSPVTGIIVVAAVTVLWRLINAANGTAALCLALAVLVHALLRLPTGNLWDAVLDPLLVVVSLGLALRAAAGSRHRRPAAAVSQS